MKIHGDIFAMKFVVMYTIFYAISSVSARKVYDIEEEALKLYGEDLNAVLLRFRKSPDYLIILQDKVTGMIEELSNMIIQVQEYCTNEMNAKILQTLGVTTSTISPQVLRSKMHRQYPFYSPLHVKMRRDEDYHADKPPASRLDHYSKLHHALSTANINYFKAVGFEFAGRAVHTVIKHMGPDDTPARSTQQPYDGILDDRTSSTTEHEHFHQVKPSPDFDITPHALPEASPQVQVTPPYSLRYAYNKMQ